MADQADRLCSVLAYGDLKRVELAIALANQPMLLLMDEPTAGMAPGERMEVMRLAAEIALERMIGVLFIEHDMNVMFAHATRVCYLLVVRRDAEKRHEDAAFVHRRECRLALGDPIGQRRFLHRTNHRSGEMLASKDAGMGPVASGTAATPPRAGIEVPKAGEVPESGATPAMNEALKGRAASPEDVLRQNQGQPTASEAAQAGRVAPAPALSGAMASLQRARKFDKAGNEAECMAAIQQAKDQIPSR